MKKIIFTVTNDLTYDRRMHRICTSLAKAGYDVLLVGRKLKNSQPFENQHFKSKRFTLFFNKGKLFYIEYNIRLFFWLLFRRFDIICAIDLDTILSCFVVLSVRGTKQRRWGGTMVYDAHELFTEVPEVIQRPKVRKIWLALERFIVPKLKHCYTVSQSIVEEFDRRYQIKFDLIRNLPLRTTDNGQRIMDNGQRIMDNDVCPLSVIHCPLSVVRCPLSIILYQGSLNEGRGLETAIEAMHDIENAVLWIAGEGDLSEVLGGMVRAQNLDNKVKFLGYIVPDELPSITAQATIGLNVLEDKGLSYQFSLANKFLDYIQAGVPQICTQFVEYQRINEQYEVAILIEKTDKALLTQAINGLLNDNNAYKKLQNNCFRAAEKLCWEEEEKRLIAFYNRL
jgi:glycosyltransferase involved in cell wall biosynthesis